MVTGESSQPPVKDTTLTFQYVIDPGLADAKKNNIVKGLLFQSIPEDLVLQSRNLKIGKEMWEAIKTRNLGVDRVKEARLQTLLTEFKNLKMSDNDNINAYVAKLPGIVSKSATLGEQVLDLKTTGFEDVVGRLKAYEEIVKEEDKANDAQENLLYAMTEYSNGNNDSSRGRGRDSNSQGCGQVPCSANRLYKAQLKVGKEYSNQAGREPRILTVVWNEAHGAELEQQLIENANLEQPMDGSSARSPVHAYILKYGDKDSGSDDTPNPYQSFTRKRLCEDQAREICNKDLKRRCMEDCNATLCLMEPRLKLSKAEDEPEVEATQYQNLVGCLRYLLHTRPDLMYSVGVVSRYMQSLRELNARAIKQILRYLKGLVEDSTLSWNNLLFKNVRRKSEEIQDIIMVTVRLKLPMLLFKNTHMVNHFAFIVEDS
ncbi:uncharacterized mitochondrial protein-like protein [Tanacetum coccineum]